jgi:hypothetical protein
MVKTAECRILTEFVRYLAQLSLAPRRILCDTRSMKSPLHERTTSEQRSSRRVVFLVLPSVQLLDLAGPAQVFDTARRLGASYLLSFCATTDEVCSAQHLHLSRLERLPEILPGDLILIRFLEIWEQKGWRLKVYGITYQGEYPRPHLLEQAKALASDRLPALADAPGCYGVGFLGVHDGRGTDFLYLDWWAEENELHHHLSVVSHQRPDHFEYATPTGLIACVWDLRVLSFEREAWVASVLANPHGPDLEHYLRLRLNEDS